MLQHSDKAKRFHQCS